MSWSIPFSKFINIALTAVPSNDTSFRQGPFGTLSLSLSLFNTWVTFLFVPINVMQVLLGQNTQTVSGWYVLKGDPNGPELEAVPLRTATLHLDRSHICEQINRPCKAAA